MEVAIIQHSIKLNDVEYNLNHFTQMLTQHSGVDLYVFAETFATGFMAEGSEKQTKEKSQLILDWMKQQASLHDAAVCGSVSTLDDLGRMRNRLLFVRPDGSYDYYDKRHLFSYAGENKVYAGGDRRVVLSWRGVRFLLQVCYDLRFPVFSRNLGDYDAIIYVANWPSSRRDVWQTLLKARALENQCYVVGVNIVGEDKNCQYAGDSVVHDAYGRVVASCTCGEEGVAKAELNIEELVAFRQKFPVLDDADKYNIL